MQKTRTTGADVQTALDEMKKERDAHVSTRDTAALEEEPVEDTEELMSLLEILAKVGSFPFEAFRVVGYGAGTTATLTGLVNTGEAYTCDDCGQKYLAKSITMISVKCRHADSLAWGANFKKWRPVDE